MTCKLVIVRGANHPDDGARHQVHTPRYCRYFRYYRYFISRYPVCANSISCRNTSGSNPVTRIVVWLCPAPAPPPLPRSSWQQKIFYGTVKIFYPYLEAESRGQTHGGHVCFSFHPIANPFSRHRWLRSSEKIVLWGSWHGFVDRGHSYTYYYVLQVS